MCKWCSLNLCACWLLALLSFGVNDARQYNADNTVDYWLAYAPGRLLQKLDTLTDAAMSTADRDRTAWQSNVATTTIRSPQPAPPLPQLAVNVKPTAVAALRKVDEHEEAEDDISGEDELSTASDDAAANDEDIHAANDDDDDDDGDDDDYEHKYEQFVREYFSERSNEADAALPDDISSSVEVHQKQDSSELHTDVEHDDDNDDDAEDEVEPAAKPSNVAHRKTPNVRCRKLQRGNQQCKICKNPKNNEISETCSYAHEEAPQNYAYGSAKQYKRYKQQPDTDIDSDSTEEQNSKDIGRTTPRRGKKLHQRDDLCVRRLQDQEICYHCKENNRGAAKYKRCYPATTKSKPRRRHSAVTHNAEKRIFKRTVAYAYEQQAQQTPPPLAENQRSAESRRHSITILLPATVKRQRRMFLKFVRTKRDGDVSNSSRIKE